MDIKSIYVIVELDKYTKEDIIKDIKEEGYKHHFFFGNLQSFETAKKHLVVADEVWCFGNVSNTMDYQYAKERGMDLWQMK